MYVLALVIGIALLYVVLVSLEEDTFVTNDYTVYDGVISNDAEYYERQHDRKMNHYHKRRLNDKSEIQEFKYSQARGHRNGVKGETIADKRRRCPKPEVQELDLEALELELLK